MRRTERLFALAEALRARRTGVTAEALAERFGVAVRTIYRDLASLRDAQLPLNAERGRGGGYALDRTYALPPVNFSAREAAVLIAGGRWLSEMRVVPFRETLGAAMDKVVAALSASAQRALLEHLQTLRFVGVPARPVDARVARAVERAYFEQAVLRVTYVSAEQVETTRRVRIESVLMERGETRLNCHDLDRDEPRQLRLDRIVRARVLR